MDLIFTLNLSLVLLYLALAFKTYAQYGSKLVAYYYVVFFQVWTVLSVFYNDVGIDNIELFRQTYTSFSTAYLCAFYILFHVSFVNNFPKNKGFSFIFGNNTAIFFYKYKFFLLSTIIGCSISLVVLYFYKNGFNLTLDRADYFFNSLFIESLFIKYASILSFTLGLLATFKNRSFAPYFGLFFILLYLFLIGNKFSLLVEIIFSFIVPLAVLINKNNILRALPIFVFFGTVFIFFKLNSYYLAHGSIDEALNILSYRIFGGQGAIWWGSVDYYVVDNQWSLSNLYTEVGALGGTKNESEMVKIMTDLLGYEVTSDLLERGYLYTMAFPAILLTMMPIYAALPFMLIFGYIFSVIILYLNDKIRKGHFIRAVIAFSVVIPFINFTQSGSFSVFFTLGIMLKILVLIFMENITRKRL